MSKEEWRDVKGYEGLYKISNKGNLMSCRSGKWRVLKNTNKTGWYFTVNLYDFLNRKKTFRIHRLVAETFISPIPRGFHVHHKDGNRQNNDVNNLEILHPQMHCYETRKDHPNFSKGITHFNRYVKPKHISQYTLEGDFIAEYANSQIAESLTGVCARNILQVANKQQGRKQAGGFVWKFSEREGVVV